MSETTAAPRAGAAANVPDAERWLSSLTGGALVLWGIRRRTPTGALLAGAGSYLVYRGATGRCLAYRAIGAPAAQPGDAIGAPLRRAPLLGPVTIERTITINRPPAEVAAAFTEPANLARVLPMLESVTATNAGRLRWVARGPAGRTLAWETEPVAPPSAERVAWRTVPGGDLSLTSEARFTPAPGNRGAEVHLRVTVEPPGSPLGAALARLATSSPAAPVATALRHLKQLLETGEIPTTAGQPRGQAGRPTPPALTPHAPKPTASPVTSSDQPSPPPDASHATSQATPAL